jgi:hypothetical protein
MTRPHLVVAQGGGGEGGGGVGGGGGRLDPALPRIVRPRLPCLEEGMTEEEWTLFLQVWKEYQLYWEGTTLELEVELVGVSRGACRCWPKENWRTW